MIVTVITPNTEYDRKRALDNSAYLNRAEDYDAENEHKPRTMVKKARVLFATMKGHMNRTPQSILEIGCGTGLFTQELATQFPAASIVATDAYEPMLTIASRRLARFPNVRLAVYDAQTAGSFEERFEIICGVDLIHHLNDPVAALRNWRTLAAPGAGLVFFESNALNPVLRLRTRNRPEEARFKLNTRKNLRSWTDAAGWEHACVDYVPLHLPNGPSFLWSTLDRAERLMHVFLWPFSGGMVVCGQASRNPISQETHGPAVTA